MRPTKIRLLALTLGVLCLAAACSSSTSSDSTATTDTTSAPLTLPAKLTGAGVVLVATSASYAPNEFFGEDGVTLQGMDIDLGKAIGDVLGIEFRFENVTFNDILPAVGTTYDLGMSSITDTTERQQTVDFVDYFQAGTAFLVATGRNADLSTLEALCGKNVAVETGTTQEALATTQSATCTSSGQAAIAVQPYPTQNEANLALSGGRADVVLLSSPAATWQADQSNGTLQVVGEVIAASPYGIAVPKSAEYAGLAQAIQGALERLAARGTYREILTKWGVQAGAVDTFPINGVTS